jgi:hypothetical protein
VINQTRTPLRTPPAIAVVFDSMKPLRAKPSPPVAGRTQWIQASAQDKHSPQFCESFATNQHSRSFRYSEADHP